MYQNKRMQSGISATELVFGVAIMGIVSVGGSKLYNNLKDVQEKVEHSTELVELKQYIRTNFNCEKTSNYSTTKKVCARPMIGNNGELLGQGATDQRYVDKGVNCDNTDLNPYQSGFHVYGNFDFTIKQVKEDGQIEVFARSSHGDTENNNQRQYNFKDGQELFDDAPLYCTKIIPPPPVRCAADSSHSDPMTFPAGVDCNNNNCHSELYKQVRDKLSDCHNIALPFEGYHRGFMRSSNAHWFTGNDSRWRCCGQSEGTLETDTLKFICRVLGYDNYVSSDPRDYNDKRGEDRLNWTSTSDNSNWRLKNSKSFDDLVDGMDITDILTMNNRITTWGISARYQTWVNQITCSGKIP